MVERMYPEEYFIQLPNNDKTLIYLGLIILGIIACVTIAVVGLVKK